MAQVSEMLPRRLLDELQRVITSVQVVLTAAELDQRVVLLEPRKLIGRREDVAASIDGTSTGSTLVRHWFAHARRTRLLLVLTAGQRARIAFLASTYAHGAESSLTLCGGLGILSVHGLPNVAVALLSLSFFFCLLAALSDQSPLGLV